MRLLLVEDDESFGVALSHFLTMDGHHVDRCTNLAQAKMLVGESYDAILLDWNLPDGSGVEWLAYLRARGNDTPVLVLTANDRLDDRILCLDCGADDFLVKPFAAEELTARLRAVKRRSSGTIIRRQFGHVEVDVSARVVWSEGKAVEMTAREWTILEALVTRAGRIVSKRDLESIVMGPNNDLTSNSLEVYVSKLRAKLGRETIETIRGMGYRIGRP